MTFRLLTALCSLTLSLFIQAASNTSAEEDYQKALAFGEQVEAQYARLISLEQSTSDKTEFTSAWTALSESIEGVQENLRKASDSGHPVASYLLANVLTPQLLGQKNRELNQAEACRLYQTAADQGLLAAAVAVLRDCEKATRRFNFDDPELERLRIQLRNALHENEVYGDYYPLPARISYCFKESPDSIPLGNSGQPFSQLKAALSYTSLSLEQFRADGYYLLAIKSGDKTPALRSDVDHALAQGCIDPLQMDKFVKRTSSQPIQAP